MDNDDKFAIACGFVVALGFLAVMIAIVVCVIPLQSTDEKDCAHRHGQFVNSGKYGDDLCVVKGKIVRIYR